MGTDVDPQLLFQRALNFASSGVVNTTLEECLRYELCPISMSLFDVDGYMRTATKSTLATYLVESCLFEDFPLKTMKIVLDGGALLHRVGWTKTDTFDRIVHGYHSYIRNMFGNRRRPISVVFDGYSQSSTKDDCHNKRQPISSLSIEFSLEKKLLCKKPVYL